jgi:hypothetical protein
VPRILDTSLLEQLEHRWTRHGVPLSGSLVSGIGDDQIDRLAAPLGFSMTEEARRVPVAQRIVGL